jgi:hypothetical protein
VILDLEYGAMNKNTFCMMAALIFAVVALVHLLRLYFGWPAVIGEWSVPMWVSWLGFIVTGALSAAGLSLATRS